MLLADSSGIMYRFCAKEDTIMPETWVYKCNKDQKDHNSFGEWSEFFDNPDQPSEWGGSWCTENNVSKNIMNERLGKGDLIFAYQTDERSIVGTCRVNRVTGERNERIIYLEPLEWFDDPVRIHDLKQQMPALKSFSSFNGKVQGTLYPVSRDESRLLSKLCGVKLDGHLLPPGFDEFADDPTNVPTGATYPEGAVKRINVNAYERHEQARRDCIAHWGTRCVVCKFDFEKRYGGIGMGFTHVHHLKLLSKLGDGYEVDPVKDLRPVCPNCHAMLHHGGKLRSIEELKACLRPLR